MRPDALAKCGPIFAKNDPKDAKCLDTVKIPCGNVEIRRDGVGRKQNLVKKTFFEKQIPKAKTRQKPVINEG